MDRYSDYTTSTPETAISETKGMKEVRPAIIHLIMCRFSRTQCSGEEPCTVQLSQ